MNEHSIIPPSSAHIWGKPDGCPGWVTMSAHYPETEGTEAREGTIAHEYASSVLRGQRQLNYLTVLSDEMIEAVQMYVDEVQHVMDRVNPASRSGIERQVHAIRVHGQSFGTVDCYLYDPVSRTLWIWDFKTGHLIVEVFENWQMINYAAGVFDELKFNGIDDQNLTVHFRVVQPRAYHKDGPIRPWTVRGSDLRGYFNTLRMNAELALSPAAETRAGSHCRYCSARHACPTALEAGMKLYETVGKTTPVELSPEALGLQLSLTQKAAKQIEYLQTGYEEQARAILASGKAVPGYRMEHGSGRETWNKPLDQVLAVGDSLGVDLRKAEAITPNQARSAGLDPGVVSTFSHRPMKGAKLIQDDGSWGRRIFGNQP